MRPSLFFLFFFLIATTFAQQPVGIFQYNQDIGHPKKAGAGSYDEKTQVYTINGAGSNIWFNRDEFHYLYNKVKGDFILTADFEFTGDLSRANSHRKIGWMVRESEDEGAASWNAVNHYDGLCLLQWRPYKGMWMRDPEEEIFAPKKGAQTIQMQRIGSVLTMKIAHPGEPLQVVASRLMEMKPEVLVGLYICSHDSDVVAQARIWNVRIDQPLVNSYSSNPYVVKTPVRDVLGSRLEILDISSGNRKIIYESKGRFGSPYWMPDGKKLVFNEGGALYSIEVTGGNPVMLNKGSVVENKNNHPSIKEDNRDSSEYSPDRKYLYYNTNISGTMQVWRMKPGGSGKEQLTFDEYHNWFPHISPDGNMMVFISFPADIDPKEHPSYKDVMLKVMKLNAPGAPRVVAYLYGGEGTININSWSPDSKRIAFVSNSIKY